MIIERLINWFLPSGVRESKDHPRYHELFTIASTIFMGTAATCIFPILLIWYDMGEYLWMFYLNATGNLITLFGIKYTGHYRFFNIVSGILTYFIIYYWLKDSGLIYSTNICIVHMFLLGGILADKKWGWLAIISNIIYLSFIYYLTVSNEDYKVLSMLLGSPLYALFMHCLITAFLGSFLAYSLSSNETSRKKIIALRDQKINLLDEAVRQRTEQLNSMRQSIAADFHDQTGNMLAAINRQATVLQLRFQDNPEILPLIESIITNSNGLYASSKDFLWNLNNDSDNPGTLFEYLKSYGQSFYNQFDVDFSSSISGKHQHLQQLNSFAALNLIFIFKEVMNNVIKHSGATEVLMEMIYHEELVTYILRDNGIWKDADDDVEHYGLKNIERRAERSSFLYQLKKSDQGTSISIGLPVTVKLL
ncbi:sensor histidine kinase [Epilithonimonas mollis]|uniref:histidine kinase n=1 Tax=Epilithonimonas mollis TaxID=216903 RepID=A0A1M6TK01_9FLAO|nr:histidine kinase [Epilithonimonas mollis]SHK57098.1 Signal transduction histidine kinase [Epilithonimonas mollis]